jgi:hypothetical protein
MAERCQRRPKKSTKKIEVLATKELAVSLPLPLVEVWEELQHEVEHLTGLIVLKIIQAVIEDEVTRRGGRVTSRMRFRRGGQHFPVFSLAENSRLDNSYSRTSTL